MRGAPATWPASQSAFVDVGRLGRLCPRLVLMTVWGMCSGVGRSVPYCSLFKTYKNPSTSRDDSFTHRAETGPFDFFRSSRHPVHRSNLANSSGPWPYPDLYAAAILPASSLTGAPATWPAGQSAFADLRWLGLPKWCVVELAVSSGCESRVLELWVCVTVPAHRSNLTNSIEGGDRF